MIKAVGNSESGRVLFFGLSRRNVEKLQEGKPIVVDLADLGLRDGGLVVIAFGETEESIKAEVLAAGIKIQNPQED